MALIITLQPKNAVTMKLYIKQGVDPSLYDMQNMTFTDVMFPDGTLVENATFAQLQNTLYSYQGKNPTTMTDVLKP